MELGDSREKANGKTMPKRKRRKSQVQEIVHKIEELEERK